MARPDKKAGYKIGSGGDGPGPKALKHEPTDLYTGPYAYGSDDPDAIDTAGKFQLASMKSFKGAKDTSTEWLTKKNAVRSASDAPYQRFKSGEDV